MRLSHKNIIYLTIVSSCLLIANHIPLAPYAFPKVILACLACLFIPGDCLYSLWFANNSDISLWERVPITFCLGLAFLSVLGLPAYLFHLTWWTLKILVLCSSLGLWAITVKLSNNHSQTTSSNTPPGHSLAWTSKTNRTAIIILIVTTIVITAISFWLGGTLSLKSDITHITETNKLPSIIVGHRNNDKFIHWGFIKKLVDEDRIINPWDSLHYSYNIWYIFIGLISKISGANFRWIWSYAILYCIPLSILAIFSLGKALFNNERLALICSFVYLINTTLFNTYFSDMGFWGWIGAPNPREIGFILMTMISFFILKYIGSNEKKFFWATVLLGANTLFIHDIDFIFVLISLCLFAALLIIFRPQDKDKLMGLNKLIIALCLVAIPLFFIKTPSTIKVSEPLLINPNLAAPLVSASGELMGVKARQLGILPTPIIFLSFLLITLLFPRIREDKGIIFLVATTTLPPLIAYNPAIPFIISKILATLNIKVPTDSIALVSGFRTACLFPAVYICAYSLYKGIIWLNNKRLVNCLSLILGVVIALLSASQFINMNSLPKISWPFYPAWAIVLIAAINILLVISERFFYFPSRLLASKNNQKSATRSINPLPATLLLTLSTLAIAIPTQLNFFTAPARDQNLRQLSEGSAGFKYLNENISKDALILSDPVTSFYLPGYTGHRALGFEILEVKKKNQFSPLSALNPKLPANIRLNLLKKHGIKYLYLDWRIINRKLKQEVAELSQHYKLVYQDENTGIYEVR